MTTDLTSAQLPIPLNDKLQIKKRKLKAKSVGDVIQRMYNTITKYKMWDELKEEKRK